MGSSNRAQNVPILVKTEDSEMAKLKVGRGKFFCPCNYSTSNKGQWAKHQAKCPRSRTESRRAVGMSMGERRAVGKKKAA